MSSGVNKGLTAVYFISWIFIGNWTFLNLFLAILLDGFCNTTEEQEENENEDVFEEDAIIEGGE
jgi:hypothetical protein